MKVILSSPRKNRTLPFMAASADLFNLGVVLFGMACPAEIVGGVLFILTRDGSRQGEMSAIRRSVALNALIVCLVGGVREDYRFLLAFHLPSFFKIDFGRTIINRDCHSSKRKYANHRKYNNFFHTLLRCLRARTRIVEVILKLKSISVKK
jgi:hypothetical protein